MPYSVGMEPCDIAANATLSQTHIQKRTPTHPPMLFPFPPPPEHPVCTAKKDIGVSPRFSYLPALFHFLPPLFLFFATFFFLSVVSPHQGFSATNESIVCVSTFFYTSGGGMSTYGGRSGTGREGRGGEKGMTCVCVCVLASRIGVTRPFVFSVVATKRKCRKRSK